MKYLFKTTLVFLGVLFFTGNYSLAQENKKDESLLDFSIKLGHGALAASTTNLMQGYRPVHDGLLSGAVYLGWPASKTENATGAVFRFLSPSSGYSVDASGKENSLNHAFYVLGAYNRIALPIRPVENLSFIFSTEIGMVWLSRHEQIYNSASLAWDKQRKTRFGFEAGIGMHLQYRINKTVYLMAGTDLTACLFSKRINESQQKDKTRVLLIDSGIGIGLNI